MVGARTLTQSISFMAVYSMDIAATSRVAKPLTPSTVTHWRNSEKTQQTSQDIFVRTWEWLWWKCGSVNGKGKNTTTHTSNSSYNPVSLPSNLFRVLPPSQSKLSWMPSKMTLCLVSLNVTFMCLTILKIILVSYNLFSKNVSVAKQHIGPFMCEYAEHEKNKLLTQPRRTLVGNFFGDFFLGHTTCEVVLRARACCW